MGECNYPTGVKSYLWGTTRRVRRDIYIENANPYETSNEFNVLLTMELTPEAKINALTYDLKQVLSLELNLLQMKKKLIHELNLLEFKTTHINNQ
tara:strand:- start:105 stop:389 length:285 start_codon:yes stop_codon:yes gene_type:complete